MMRRLRLLLAAAAIGFLAVLGFASPASAADGDIGHAEELCIEAIEAGGTIDDCQAAPNQLMPELNEVIWGTVGFVVVLFFIGKFGFPAIKKSMDDRTERIRSDLAAAETQRAEADQLLADYRAQLADAKNESARIIEEARQAADALKREQEARLQTELAEMRTRATADIDAAKVQAIADLRGEVAELAIGAAEVVVGRSLDRPSQVQLIEDYINQVANQA